MITMLLYELNNTPVVSQTSSSAIWDVHFVYVEPIVRPSFGLITVVQRGCQRDKTIPKQ